MMESVLAKVAVNRVRFRRRLKRTMLSVMMQILPVRRHAIVYGIPDSEENALCFAVAFADHYDGTVTLWVDDVAHGTSGLEMVASSLGLPGHVEVVAKPRLRGLIDFARAEVVAYTHGLYDSPSPCGRRVHLNLWHGIGPKKSANSVLSQEIGAHLMAANTGAWARDSLVSLSAPPDSRILVGNPREDMMRVPANRHQLESLGIDADRPFVLWMPTYRRSSKIAPTAVSDGLSVMSIGDGEVSLAESLVRQSAALGVQTFVKPHPLDSERWETIEATMITDQAIRSAGITLYQLLGAADGLVSDYSSVWVDFLGLRRPMALICPDMEQYADTRGFKEPHLSVVAAPLILSDISMIDGWLAQVAARAGLAESIYRSIADSLEYVPYPTVGRKSSLLARQIVDAISASRRSWAQ